MSTWIKHLTAYYNQRKASNPNYKYKDAMKDARSSYKSTAIIKPVGKCVGRSMKDCNTRPRCKTTILGKRKSYCRTKTNKRKGNSQSKNSSSSTDMPLPLPYPGKGNKSNNLTKKGNSFLSSIFGTSTPNKTPKLKSNSTGSKSKGSKSMGSRGTCQYKVKSACKRSKSCKNTVPGAVRSYCRKTRNAPRSTQSV